jgi:hypothetical protein
VSLCSGFVIDVTDEARTCSHAGVLIEEGLYSEKEELLKPAVAARNVVARLLIVDSRLRGGKKELARDLFS